MNDISTKMQRGMLLPKGSPAEAVQALRNAFQAAGKDPAFARDFKAITGEEPDVVAPAEIEAIFNRIRKVDPAVKRVLRESVGQEG
jgi:tripartite-type tricarboxylate transporter receptor subunit TctC